MKTGDQLLVHNPFALKQPVTYLSWIIRKVCNVFYNHSAIILKVSSTYFVVEATFPRVIITEYEEWEKKYKRLVELVPVESQFTEEELQKRIIDQIGKKYDRWSLLIILQYLVTGKWRGRRGEKAAKRLYCFELVAHVHNLPEFWKVIPTQ